MIRRQMPASHQLVPTSSDILWKLRIALFGKGLRTRSKAGQRELVRPPPTVRTTAKTSGLRPQSPTARIMTLFAWCGAACRARLSDDGPHATTWPSLHGSVSNSARVSSCSSPSTYPTQPGQAEAQAHEQHYQQQQQQQQQQQRACAKPQAPVEAALATSPAASGNANRSSAHISATAEVTVIKQLVDHHCMTKASSSSSSSNTQARILSKPANTTTSSTSSSTKKPTCNIYPDDVAILAHSYQCSPAAVMKLPRWQQRHMMICEYMLQQQPLCFLGHTPTASQAAHWHHQQHQQHQQHRVTIPQEQKPAPHHNQQQQSWGPQQLMPQQSHSPYAQQQQQQQRTTCPVQQQQEEEQWALPPISHVSREPYWRTIEAIESQTEPETRCRRTTADIMRARIEREEWNRLCGINKC